MESIETAPRQVHGEKGDDHQYVLHEESKETIRDAGLATAKEHTLPVRTALSLYPKAIAWSILLSMAVIMEGFDTVLIGSYLGFPSFNNTFGNIVVDGSPSITAPWQAAVTNGAYIGEILGLQITGYLIGWFGNKKVMGGATVLMIAFIFVSFFGKTLGVQLAGQILCGIPWGVYQTVTTVYASEVLPTNLRGYLTSYVNLCWVIGQFIASGVLVGVQSRTDEWGWRIPYAIQWIWPVPLILVCIFCPESPTWLVEHGKLNEAENAFKRLQSDHDGSIAPTPQEAIALVSQTIERERQITMGAGYMDCFKGTNLRRTEITVVTWIVQQMCGPVLQTYAIYFFENAGLPSAQAFNMGLGLYAIAFVGTLLSWPMIKRFGRRQIFLWGLVSIFVSLMIVGFLSLGKQTTSTSWAIGAFLLIYTFIYDSTIGPLTYVIVPETPSSRLRHKTVVLARNAYNITCIWTGVITPYMLNTTAWNWGAKAGFFWAGSTALCLVWAYFRLPETKGFTFEEIDMLFEEKVSARKFSSVRREIAVASGGVAQ
ncbi:general substrate transporter [Kockovaella imperatae]|uniref:General substrate transporter n=1 Tax=Kockovaella imperatae TaxID=4999 RepID=A0A1Y1UDW7_9TREE|nr:general substrate transporter [Kockovaella imperatae]ORX36240.1 general substrate transporter [Kockovaella imperatae]